MEKWTTGPNAPVPGGAILVGRFGKTVAPRFFGRQGPEADAEPIRRDAMFYMASVTKPVIYLAAMLLVERGQLNLSDRVTRYIPEFTGKGKEDAQVLHLFTHTSGLPDELPNNAELRRRARAAGEVHRRVDQGRAAVQARHAVQLCQLGHHPRRRDRAAAVGAVRSASSCASEIIEPLGLKSTGLGSQGFARERLVRTTVPDYQVGSRVRLEQQVLAGVRLAGRRAVQHARGFRRHLRPDARRRQVGRRAAAVARHGSHDDDATA